MSLRQKTVNGVLWTGIGTIGSGLIGFIVTMFLSRHLTPSDFGLIEIILSLVILFEVIIDCGFSQALIREKDVSQRDLSTIFFLNMAIAISLYIGIFVAAPFIANYYSSGKEFCLVLRVLSTKMLFDAFAICQNANCNRMMRFDFLAKVTVFSMILSGLGSILSVYLGAGIWAIVIYYLGLSIIKCILLNALNRWLPSLEFDKERVKYFVRFGGSLMILKITDKAISSIESLCVGKTYSKADLGLFSQARRFENLIIQNLVAIVQKVTYPALSKVSTEERLRSSYEDVMRISVWVILPFAMYMFFFAETFLYVVFGSQWVVAAPFLRLFSVFSMLDPLYEICWNIFLVKAQTKKLLIIGLCKQILRILVLIITLQYNIYWFTAGIVLVMLAASFVYIYHSGKLIGYPIVKILRDNMLTFMTAVICFGLPYFLLYLSTIDQLSFVCFLISFCLSMVLYLVISLILKNRASLIVKAIGIDLYHSHRK